MVVTWTYDVPTNTASAQGAGATDFPALVAADIAGGWGKFGADSTGKVITIGAHIVVGDGVNAAAMSGTGLGLIFLNGVLTADNQYFVKVSSASSFVLGSAINTTAKTTSDGCQLTFLETTRYYNAILSNSSTSTTYLYGCTFFTPANGAEGFVWANRIWNCIFQGSVYPHNVFGLSSDIDSLIVGRTLRRFNVSVVTNNITMKPAGGTSCNVIWCQSSASIFKNVFLPVIPAYTQFIRVESTNANDHYFINVNKGNAVFYWAGTNTGKAYWQYEFDLQVVDNQNNGTPLQGARYRVYDKNGNELTKTGSGYTSAPNVVLSAPPAGGVQATAHAVLEPNGQGAILNFVIDNPGSGYITPPTVTVNAPASGVTATALATIIEGAVSAIIPTTYTDASGNIPTRCVTRGYYNAANGDTLQDYAPLLIVVTKDGYQEYRDEMNIAMKTAYQISMNRVVPVLVGAGGKLQVDLTPTNPVSLMFLDVG